MAKQNLGGVYANMDFPPYVWQEFPKAISTGPYGKVEIAKSAEEEAKIKARLQEEQDSAPPEPIIVATDPTKELLLSRAQELGVPFNRKWSNAKLQQVIEHAEQEMDNLPPEGEEVPAQVELELASDESEPESEEQTKDRLIAEAKSLGIQATRLWGIPRLKAQIAEANSKA